MSRPHRTRTPSPPWESPEGLRLVIAVAPRSAVGDLRATWHAALVAAIRAHHTQGATAEALGVSLRQLARWLAWLPEHAPDLDAATPRVPSGARRLPDDGEEV